MVYLVALLLCFHPTTDLQTVQYTAKCGAYIPGMQFVVNDSNCPQYAATVQFRGTISENCTPTYGWKTAKVSYNNSGGQYVTGVIDLSAANGNAWEWGDPTVSVDALLGGSNTWTTTVYADFFDSCGTKLYTVAINDTGSEYTFQLP